MAAAVAPYVDNAIAKTINVVDAIGFDDFSDCFLAAYRKGLKGCTVFRPGGAKPGVVARACR